MKKVKVTVPASTTNLGSGFDCLGLALTLYNTIEMEFSGEKELVIEVEGEGKESIPRDETNIIFPAIKMVFDRVKAKPFGLKIKEVNSIPLSRGLGSSAATRIGGLVGATLLLGLSLSREEILKMAIELEGHPDNVAASLLGGFVAVAEVEKKPLWVKLKVPDNLKVVVAVPDRGILTEKARKILPQKIPFQDALFNLSRVALLVPSLSQGLWNNLVFGTQDRLHQPYRSALLPGMMDVFEAALHAGAKGVFLSGAGSSIAALTLNDEKKIGQAMQKAFSEKGLKSRFMILSVDNQGVKINE